VWQGSSTCHADAATLTAGDDDPQCCTRNRNKFGHFLLDVETHTMERLWGTSSMDILEKVEYKIGSAFDPEPIAKKYGARKDARRKLLRAD
jgi:hypothetical protein